MGLLMTSPILSATMNLSWDDVIPFTDYIDK